MSRGLSLSISNVGGTPSGDVRMDGATVFSSVVRDEVLAYATADVLCLMRGDSEDEDDGDELYRAGERLLSRELGADGSDASCMVVSGGVVEDVVV